MYHFKKNSKIFFPEGPREMFGAPRKFLRTPLWLSTGLPKRVFLGNHFAKMATSSTNKKQRRRIAKKQQINFCFSQ